MSDHPIHAESFGSLYEKFVRQQVFCEKRDGRWFFVFQANGSVGQVAVDVDGYFRVLNDAFRRAKEAE